jgi:tetratricopeptide (TPR) repeat protein
MEREQAARLEEEAERIATRIGDLRSLTLLRMLQAGRPGLEQTTSDWIAGVAAANRLADESGDDYLRVAIRTASGYAHLCAADFEGFERICDEVLEMAGDDHGAGAGIIIGCPVAFAWGGKAIACRELGRYDEAERHVERGIRIAEERGDPETLSWNLGSKSLLLGARGEADAGLTIGRRNCEQTERLGDVFSRSLALANFGAVQCAAEDYAGALESLEEAERIYREAMDVGGEMEGWRAGIRAEALRGVGRPEEAMEVAEWAAQVSRERELLWSLPLALLALGRSRAALDREDAREPLEEAAEIVRKTGALPALESVEEELQALAAATG